VLGLLDKTSLVKDLRSHFFSDVEVRFDLRKADLDPLLLEDVGESSLGQTALQRHLSAFESLLAGVTRARFLSLVTATRGLSKS